MYRRGLRFGPGNGPTHTAAAATRRSCRPRPGHAFRFWKAAGYRTGLIGKNHCFEQPDDLARFDIWCEISHGGLPANAATRGMEWFRPRAGVNAAHELRHTLSQSLRRREAEGRRKMVRAAQWKYVHDLMGDLDELDDRVNDPWELENVVDDPQHRERGRSAPATGRLVDPHRRRATRALAGTVRTAQDKGTELDATSGD